MVSRYGFGVESFYFLFFFFLLFYEFVLDSIFKKERQRKYFFFSSFLLFFLLAAFRGITVGGDLERYLPEFHAMAYTSFDQIWDYGNHEPGYMIYIKILSLISKSDRCFLIGTSFASLVGPFFLFYKYSKQPAISILLYFAMGYYTNTFNNVRQSISLSIVFLCIPFLVNRSFWKYTICVLLAATFHYSAMAMLILYPLLRKELDFKKIITYSLSSILLISFLGLAFLNYLAAILVRLDPESFMGRQDGSGYTLFALYSFIFVVLSSFYLFKKKKLSAEQQKMMSMFVMFQMFAMAFQLAAPIFHSMVRLTYYFFIPVVTLAVPYSYSIIKSNVNKTLLYILVFGYALFYMTRVVYAYNPNTLSNSQGTIPYVFIEKTIFLY